MGCVLSRFQREGTGPVITVTILIRFLLGHAMKYMTSYPFS